MQQIVANARRLRILIDALFGGCVQFGTVGCKKAIGSGSLANFQRALVRRVVDAENVD